MKTGAENILTVLILCLAAQALPASADATGVTGAVDGGGLRTASANYVTDGSLGGIGGAASSGGNAVRPGYAGQLVEVTGLSVTGTPSQVNEGGTAQLAGQATMDDGTVTTLSGGEIAWAAPAFPIASISPAGAATSAIVWSNTQGKVAGAYMGVGAAGLVLVLESDPDNCGLYAGDKVPDCWQVQFFGVNNPDGVAGATNCTGQNNLYTYIADLDPKDPGSVLRIDGVSNQTPGRAVWFGATSTARVYRLLYATNLVGGVWTNLPETGWTEGLAGRTSISDTNTPAIRFYRVQVTAP